MVSIVLYLNLSLNLLWLVDRKKSLPEAQDIPVVVGMNQIMSLENQGRIFLSLEAGTI